MQKQLQRMEPEFSILPKVLPWFGIDAGESISILDALPFLGVLFGDMMLNNSLQYSE